jgi:hypothetical protein
MKIFLIRAALFLALIFTMFFIIFLSINKNIDPFYLRFTTPKQTSLVLGTSRAAQGIQPEVLNKTLGRNDIFNYSFTIDISPFGPNYFNIIEKKIDTTKRDGIFIVTIDPWSISSRLDELNDIKKFRELSLQGHIDYVNMNPNIFYLLLKYEGPFFNLLFKKNSYSYLHNDGWLEINVPMDSSSLEYRLNDKIKTYREKNLLNYKYSEIRLEYAIKTIDYLKKYGEVYLIRLPIYPLMLDVENQFMPDFDSKVARIKSEANVDYYDMTDLNSKLIFVDGNHLYKASGEIVSATIGKYILMKRSTGN